MDSFCVDRKTPAGHLLGPAEVKVWMLPLDVSSLLRNRLEVLLCPAERYRASRFHFELHRNRFIVGRSSLRLILGHYLEVDPKLIEFVYGPQGKPALTPRTKNDDVQFNLAHADSVGLVAITRTAAIGVDIERIRPLSDMNQLVRRFFSPRENRAFQKLAAELKPAAFFNLWTRKEAWLKATGQGIAHYLHQVEVSFLPGEPARLLGLPGELRCGEEWSLRDLKTAPGFAAALAVSCEEPIVTCRRWDFPDSADVAVEQSSKSTLEIPGRARTSVHNQQVLFSKP